MKTEIVKKYLRLDKMPTVWCPGCGHGIIMGSLLRALELRGRSKDDIALVSGIGCSGRTPGYVDVHTLHTTHGRAIAFATGIKMMNPEMSVIVVMGDGDCAAIGGNHFIHAARRNMDITAVVYNNGIYGMTGGQVSPTTPYDAFATTAPYGQMEPPFDIVELALGAGATYVARSSVIDVPKLDELIVKGIKNNGFSVIDVITPCPIAYGRRNKLTADPMKNMQWVKEVTVPRKKAEEMSEKELRGKWITGVFRDVEHVGLVNLYIELEEKLKRAKENKGEEA
ncbi:2-oxoacid:ferredoxin oxidoreductase subunit beta [candidate division WOR-3 bacterium]|nr:2-oxoacid:ferredoxin oxidoreductase subunit beta [candidate division WOR-3 bacterium]